MINTPFEDGHARKHNEADVGEASRTSWKYFPDFLELALSGKKLQREQRTGEGENSSQD